MKNCCPHGPQTLSKNFQFRLKVFERGLGETFLQKVSSRILFFNSLIGERANRTFKILRETPLLVRRPMKDSEKVLRETPLFFRNPMKDIFNVLRKTPLIFWFSIKDSEKTCISKIPRRKAAGLKMQRELPAACCGVEFTVSLAGFLKISKKPDRWLVSRSPGRMSLKIFYASPQVFESASRALGVWSTCSRGGISGAPVAPSSLNLLTEGSTRASIEPTTLL